MADRQLSGNLAILEAIDQSMAADDSVYIVGLGVPDPKGIFGTTAGLQDKYGARRVMDMPTSENGMTGVIIGSAVSGLRPIMTHQRIDFALLSMEQIVNQAAKWRYMYGGQGGVPLVIRMIVGRGWGQGPQHSQSLEALFAHIPGLKVVLPATPSDAKGLMAAAIQDDDPVIFIEHRWIYGVSGPVPEELFTVPLGKANVAREGDDVSIVASSFMTLESLRAADMLKELGVSAEVVDLRTIRPLDTETVNSSVRKTGRVVAVDNSWKQGGVAGEILAAVAEECFSSLNAPPQRVAQPDSPSPSTPALANVFYPRAMEIARTALETLGRSADSAKLVDDLDIPLDVPNPGFTGPF